MNFKKALIVYRKEILEMLRDKRTLFTTIVLPVIMYPLLFMGFSAIMSRQSDVLEKRGASVAFVDSTSIIDIGAVAVKDTLINRLNRTEYLTLLRDLPHAEKRYEDKELQSIVTISDSMSASGIPVFTIDVKYDASNERGRLIFSKIEKVVSSVSKDEISARLQKAKVDSLLIRPIRVEQTDTSTKEKKMGTFLGMFLPYLMILTLVAGAATIAADLVAGEKERRTLETLLVSSATRSEIVMGKYLTIISMAMLNVVINLISLSFSVRFLLSRSGLDTEGIQMPVNSFLILLLAMVPLATLFAALLLSISTFSRNMKEARTYEQPILMVSMMLGMISFIPSVEINNLLALVPVVNISLLFKAVMINEYSMMHLILTVGSTLVLDVLAVWVTVKLFNNESILFRTEDDTSIKNVKRDKTSLFNPFYGGVYFALALAALYYIGGYLQGKDIMKGLVQTQILLILLPVFVILRSLKLKPAEILRLKVPKPGEVILIPFIAIAAAFLSALLAQILNKFFPISQSYVEAMSKLLTQDIPLWQTVLILGVAPGICEEIMFRGFLLRFFEKNGKVAAVLITALLFAVFHLDPFKMIGVLPLGILLGYLTLRSGSIYNSMISHFVNNSLIVILANNMNSAWVKPLVDKNLEVHYWVAIPATIVLVGSLWAFHNITRNKENG